MSNDKKVKPKARRTRKGSEMNSLRKPGGLILQNTELTQNLQEYKGREVLWGDNVKDECGYRAVFAGQGASALQMAPAKFLDTISKFPDMAGGASDVSATHSSQNE